MAVVVLSGSKLYPCDILVDASRLSLIESEGLVCFCDVLMESCQVFPSVELIVDLSILDKAFYSGGIVGGLSFRELFYLVGRLKLMRNLSGVRIFGDDESLVAKIS